MLREAHPRHGNVETLLLPALKDRASVADGVGEVVYRESWRHGRRTDMRGEPSALDPEALQHGHIEPEPLPAWV